MIKRFLIIIFGDILIAFASLMTAYLIRMSDVPFVSEPSRHEILRVSVFVTVVLFSSFLLEIYPSISEISLKESAVRIILALIVSFFVIVAIFYVFDVDAYGRGILSLSLIFFGILQFAWHYLFRLALNLPGIMSRVLILGTGPLAFQIGNLLSAKNNACQLAGYVNCSAEPVMVPYHQLINLETGLVDVVEKVNADKIVVSLSERRGVFPLQEVLGCKLSGIEVVDAPSFYEQMTGKLLLENITPSWFIFSHGFKVTSGLRLLKRLTDILCAFIGISLVVPFVPFIMLLIRFDSPGPVFFRQSRVGEGEKAFTLYKFRSMRQDAESGTGAVWATEKDPRVTRIGEFLRKSRIDEIPQLFNVLRGDMSLVGPRPERPEFVEKLKEVIPYYSERHYIKPGVTGWAQVKYPYGASVEDAIEKLRYDLYYIKNISFTFDVLIILETVKVVLFRRGGR